MFSDEHGESNWRECPAPRSDAAGDRMLLKGGIVMSMDPAIGDFWKADVLDRNE
jgi:hypothetical protein